MRDKIYKQISVLIDSDIEDKYSYFSLYIHLFKRKSEETKAGGYGGYQLANFVGDFNNEINKKSDELLEQIDKLFIGSGRKLSPKQYNNLINKCTKTFDSIIDNFAKTFYDEFDLNGTIETTLIVSKERISSKISGHINMLKIMSNTKVDKALMWTAIGTVFAGLSLILSIIAIIVSL